VQHNVTLGGQSRNVVKSTTDVVDHVVDEAPIYLQGTIFNFSDGHCVSLERDLAEVWLGFQGRLVSIDASDVFNDSAASVWVFQKLEILAEQKVDESKLVFEDCF